MSHHPAHPLVYVVSALDVGEDPVTPSVVGIYTTRDRAITAYFQSAAETYRTNDDGGTFEPVYGIRGQLDVSADFILTENSPSRRVLLEHNGENPYEAVVVAINAVRCNMAVEQTVPLLEDVPPPFVAEDDEASSSVLVDEPPPEGSFLVVEKGSKQPKKAKVRVLMAATLGLGFDRDVSLLGVFFSKDAALKVARHDFAKHCDPNGDGGDDGGDDDDDGVIDRTDTV
eukprot:CAMPEP_0178605872 /NCGR_PEP_ID=MMETSP0697-20121206/36796_1 /TAXON_ID=265572 /ORGANISM="Extubocellulus spinifer, Strain CCMP396" /LENGTH=227 /DNA_ID=CAMNT_0020244313 /DNA_START=8 /DNA_END=688 /DNA_ORIENTATION=-